MLSKEEMFCLVFARNARYVDRFESAQYPSVTGHLLPVTNNSEYDAIAVLIFDGEDYVEVIACKQLKFNTAKSMHLVRATQALYDMASEHGLAQQVPF